MGFGDDVLMLHRDDRNADPDHPSGAPGEIARRRDDVLADDVALVGDDFPFAARQPLERGHARVPIDLGPAVPCGARQRLGQVGRLDIAVLRVLNCADDAVDVAERPKLLDLIRREELDRDPDRLGDAGIVAVLIEPVAGAGEADVGDLAQADVEPRLGLEVLVERDRIFVDLSDGITEVEERQKAGRMPGRAGGQLLALDEHAIGPALLDEMVKRRNADDAAADHHRPSLRSHEIPSISHSLLPPAGEGGPKGRMRGGLLTCPHPAALSARPPSPALRAKGLVGRVRH